MKNLLVITPTINPLSGIGRYSEGVINGLKDEQVFANVLSEDKAPVSTYTLNASRSILSIFSNMRIARKYADELNAEVVHAFDIWPHGLYAYAAVAGTNRKLILSGIGTYSVPPHKRSLKRLLFWIVMRRTAAIVCISKYTKFRIDKEFPKLQSTVVVPIAASPLPIPSQDEVDETKEKFDIGNAFPLVLTIGEIKDRKGQLDTVKAIATVKMQYPNVVYCIVGSTNDKDYLKDMRTFIDDTNLAENIRILSVLDDMQIASLYSLADVFVLASNNDHHGHFEGFGIVFLEAAQFGVPGIGTLDCGIGEVIQDGVNGFLVHQRSPDEIADAIQRVISEDGPSLKDGTKKVAEDFSWSRTAKQYIVYY